MASFQAIRPQLATKKARHKDGRKFPQQEARSVASSVVDAAYKMEIG